MENWQIVVLVIIGLGLIMVVISHMKAQAVIKAKANSTTGQISGALKNIPGYKQALGVVGIAERPAAAIVNGVLNGTSSALSHIPIAGQVLAAPVKLADNIVNGTLHALGF